MSSTILLLHFNHSLECRHRFLYTTIQPMDLDSFVALVFQDRILILSDAIEYHCLFYTKI